MTSVSVLQSVRIRHKISTRFDRRSDYLLLLNFNQKTNLTLKLTLKGVYRGGKTIRSESFVCWRCRHLNVDCSRNYISRDWIGGQKIIPFFATICTFWLFFHGKKIRMWHQWKLVVFMHFALLTQQLRISNELHISKIASKVHIPGMVTDITKVGLTSTKFPLY